jgi:hypothetical protein
MSPEVAIVVIVVLLWGPTALWLIFRSSRSATERQRFREKDAEPESASANAVERLVDDGGYWICTTCRSLNRPDTTRCYNCRAAAAPTPPVAGEAGRPMVPVIFADTAPPATESALNDTQPVEARATHGDGRSVDPLPEEVEHVRPVPVANATGESVDGGRRDSPATGEAPTASARRAAAASPPPLRGGGDEAQQADLPAGAVVSPPARVSQLRGAAARLRGAAARQSQPASTALWSPSSTPEASPLQQHQHDDSASVASTNASREPLICPHLGSRDDRLTRFDFPFPGNACHVGVDAGGRRQGGRLQRVVQRLSRRGPLAVTVDHQASMCLTADHVRCPRYVRRPVRDAMSAGANPTPMRPSVPVAPEATGTELSATAALELPSPAQPQPPASAASAAPASAASAAPELPASAAPELPASAAPELPASAPRAPGDLPATRATAHVPPAISRGRVGRSRGDQAAPLTLTYPPRPASRPQSTPADAETAKVSAPTGAVGAQKELPAPPAKEPAAARTTTPPPRSPGTRAPEAEVTAVPTARKSGAKPAAPKSAPGLGAKPRAKPSTASPADDAGRATTRRRTAPPADASATGPASGATSHSRTKPSGAAGAGRPTRTSDTSSDGGPTSRARRRTPVETAVPMDPLAPGARAPRGGPRSGSRSGKPDAQHAHGAGSGVAASGGQGTPDEPPAQPRTATPAEPTSKRRTRRN